MAKCGLWDLRFVNHTTHRLFVGKLLLLSLLMFVGFAKIEYIVWGVCIGVNWREGWMSVFVCQLRARDNGGGAAYNLNHFSKWSFSENRCLVFAFQFTTISCEWFIIVFRWFIYSKCTTYFDVHKRIEVESVFYFKFSIGLFGALLKLL